MVLRKMLLGGAAALTLGGGLVGPAFAQAAEAPQIPVGPALVGPAQAAADVQAAAAQAAIQSAATQVVAAQPAAAQPAASQADASQPDAARPEAAQQDAAQPNLDPAGAARPDAAPPSLAQAGPDQSAAWFRPGPSLTIHKAHEDPVDHAVTYTLWVGNEGTASSRGRYTVVDTLPDGVVATSVNGGRRWDCSADSARTVVTCRSDADLAPDTSSDPITLHTNLTDKDACYLVNVAGVTGGDFGRGDMHLTKDSLKLPCHDDDKRGINVNVNVTGNNNGGRGGDSSGATANDNGHVHGVTGGFAKADADAKSGSKSGSKADARSKARARAEARSRAHAGIRVRRVTVQGHRWCGHGHHPVHHRVRHHGKGC
jgi:hypothetical protein